MRLKIQIRKTDRDFRYDKVSFAFKCAYEDKDDDLILKKEGFKPQNSCYNIEYQLSDQRIYFKEARINIYHGNSKEIYDFRGEISLKTGNQIILDIGDKNVTLIFKTKKHTYKIHPYDSNNQKKFLWFYF